MRYIVIFATILLTACSGVQTIPPDQMEDIIKDALLTAAIKNNDPTVRTMLNPQDSNDFYLAVLTRRGYTMADFRNTVKQMSTRKSNPLNAILDKVVTQIDQQALIAEKRYGVAKRFDSIAMAHYADTIYRRDTIIRGSTAKYKIVIDTTIAAGDYVVHFDYQSVDDYRAGTKSITYRTGDTLKLKPTTENGTLWVSRQKERSVFDGRFTIRESHDTLRLTFKDPKLEATYAKKFKDSSYIERIRVIYHPPVVRARRDYYLEYFGKNNLLFKNYNPIQNYKLIPRLDEIVKLNDVERSIKR